MLTATCPDRGWLRVVRAAVIACCIVGLSLAAHVSAGGRVPGVAILVGSGVIVAAYAGALTRNRLSLGELAGALGAGQVVLHTAFMTAGGGHSGGLEMIAGHAVATVLLALVLARGEDAAWALWCRLLPRLVVPTAPARPVAERVDYLAATASARVQDTWIGTSLTWRGPPLMARHHR